VAVATFLAVAAFWQFATFVAVAPRPAVAAFVAVARSWVPAFGQRSHWHAFALRPSRSVFLGRLGGRGGVRALGGFWLELFGGGGALALLVAAVVGLLVVGLFLHASIISQIGGGMTFVLQAAARESVELRSTGQPGAAVPTWVIALSWGCRFLRLIWDELPV